MYLEEHPYTFLSKRNATFGSGAPMIQTWVQGPHSGKKLPAGSVVSPILNNRSKSGKQPMLIAF